MGDLTKNFNRDEFWPTGGEPWPMDENDALDRLAEACQAIRDEVGRPVEIISGYRPLEYNRDIGSKDTSQHTGRNPAKGTPACAVDIRCRLDTGELHKTILDMIRAGKIPNGGVGLYTRSGFVHYDDRCHYGRKPARWGR